MRHARSRAYPAWRALPSQVPRACTGPVARPSRRGRASQSSARDSAAGISVSGCPTPWQSYRVSCQAREPARRLVPPEAPIAEQVRAWAQPSNLSDIEKHRFAIALQSDVEPELRSGGLRLCDQGGAAGMVSDRGQHRISSVGLHIIAKVNPGHRSIQHAAREDSYIYVRRLHATVWPWQSARSDGDDPVLAMRVRRAPAEAPKSWNRGLRCAARIVRMIEPGLRISLPGLDQRVGDRLTGAVEHLAGNDDRTRGVWRDYEGAVVPRQSNRQKRADSLGWRDTQVHPPCSFSKTVALRPRSTMSQL